MYKQSLLLAFTLLLLSLPTQAKIYQWTDSDGKKHFSQTPPLKQKGTETPKIEIRKENYARISGITKKNGDKYCGHIMLPTETDPIIQLANANIKKAEWKKQAIRQQERLIQYYDQQLNGRDRKDIIEYTKNKIDNLECASNWSKRVTLRLQKKRKDFEEKLKSTRKEYLSFKNRCGEKPDIQGWTNDKKAIAWAECEYSSHSTRKHNQKLRELKQLEIKASILSKSEN
ncbi:MAG: DUF4124 domain-containing protein [Cocleimonas sp.]